MCVAIGFGDGALTKSFSSQGHKDQEPTQVAVVPPALERQIPDKVKKMRLKPPSDPMQTTITTPLMTVL